MRFSRSLSNTRPSRQVCQQCTQDEKPLVGRGVGLVGAVRADDIERRPGARGPRTLPIQRLALGNLGAIDRLHPSSTCSTHHSLDVTRTLSRMTDSIRYLLDDRNPWIDRHESRASMYSERRCSRSWCIRSTCTCAWRPSSSCSSSDAVGPIVPSPSLRRHLLLVAACPLPHPPPRPTSLRVRSTLAISNVVVFEFIKISLVACMCQCVRTSSINLQCCQVLELGSGGTRHLCAVSGPLLSRGSTATANGTIVPIPSRPVRDSLLSSTRECNLTLLPRTTLQLPRILGPECMGALQRAR